MRSGAAWLPGQFRRRRRGEVPTQLRTTRDDEVAHAVAEPFCIAPRVPATTSGRIGTPASTARRNAPSLKGSRSSVRERVPSGKIITDTPLRSRSRHASSASARLLRSVRRTGMSPARYIIHPITGMRKMDSLLSHFISQGRWLIRKMSARDS